MPDRFDTGMAVRRSVLGDAHVDRAEAAKTEYDLPFQTLITESAWGNVWASDVIPRRERSMLTLALLAAMGVAASDVPNPIPRELHKIVSFTSDPSMGKSTETPCWSPDSQWLAYLQEGPEDGSNGGSACYRVMLYSIETQAIVQATDGRADAGEHVFRDELLKSSQTNDSSSIFLPQQSISKAMAVGALAHCCGRAR